MAAATVWFSSLATTVVLVWTAHTILVNRWDVLGCLTLVSTLIVECAKAQLLVWTFGVVTGHTPPAAARLILRHAQDWTTAAASVISGVGLLRVSIIAGALVYATLRYADPRLHPPNYTRDVGDAAAHVVAGVLAGVWMGLVRGSATGTPAAWYVILTELVVAITVSQLVAVGRLGLEERMARRPAHARLATVVRLTNRGTPIPSQAHEPAGLGVCCVCDTEKELTYSCVNIADRVCLACVVRWATRAPPGSNNWPCCRGS
jgi:hypothetical protein